MSLRSFISGGDTGKTQGEIDDRRKQLAYAMLQQGMESGPVQSPWQGAARLVQALMGGLALRRQEQQASGAGGAAPAGDPGYFPFAPLPDNGPVPPERPNLDPLMTTDDRGGQPMAPAAQPGAGLFAPLPDNGPIPTPRPYRDPMVTTGDRRQQPMAGGQPPQFPLEHFGDPVASPTNPPIPTPRPYRDPMVTTDYRREQPMATDQPGDESFAPLPDNGPIPSLRPGYRDPQVTTDERRQQPAAPVPGGGGAGSANDGAELQTILSDPVRSANLPAGMRNNNPANLKYVGQHGPGIIGPSENTDQGDPQVVYATPEAGMRHNVWQIMRKYQKGMLTPNQMIAGANGWTPNSFTAAANIARSMGIDPDDDLRLTDPAMAKKFMRALITQEQGTSGALYPDSMIEAAIAAQLNDATANVPVPTPRPEYPDPPMTTDERRQQPATAPQLPGDDPFVPPGKVPIPAPKPGRHDRQAVRGTPSQQPVDADVFNGFMDTVKNGYKQRDGSIIQVTNPYGLSAIASTGQSESQFSAKKANSSWSDRSESGKDGTSGGIMSWRNSRLQKLYNFAAAKGEKPGAISPQTQAEFFLQEDPRLIARLNAAKSLDEAQTLMNRAWQFVGYDKPGDKEVAERLATAKTFMPQYQTGGAADPFALPDNPSGPTPGPGPRDRKQTMNQGRGRAASQAAGKADALVRALLAQQQSGLW
ncbi:phage tail tip lysozyme [Rhizobium binxianense]|uniref:phage tail tip lysozyme n=1 Tax=Rhizobium binxianense TaxID=3024242 RepID=UPI00234F3CB9|nr:phage tail tip lysozyme [Rhizobium sp. BC56]MDC7743472.1 phage tail tip lysozyme [Rhizobium sp. BC56]